MLTFLDLNLRKLLMQVVVKNWVRVKVTLMRCFFPKMKNDTLHDRREAHEKD